MGDGRHARFALSSGGARARAVAFGCDGRLPAAPGQAVDATFRLQRNEWRGLVEPRLVLRHAERCAPAPIDTLAEPGSYLAGVLAELDAPLPAAEPVEWTPAPTERTLLDRREESPLAVLADAISSGERVLALCADVPRRLGGLSDRLGGFSLACHHALERRPELAETAGHLVALDPPASARDSRTLRVGQGVTHLAWGEAELRFAWQMHELEYGLRASLVALFRSLRQRGRVAGEELEQLLRGDGQHGRPARLAGRLIRVLAELELVSLDRDPPALAVASDAPTSLDRSPAYRAYEQRHKDGLRYLSSAKLPPDG
jgi:single-stranded-DNA-specific exonuclease